MNGLLVFIVVLAVGWFLHYLWRTWPGAKRTLFETHCDDALRVVDEDRELDAFCYRLRDEVKAQPEKDDAEFWAMVHPSSGNGLCDLDTRPRP